MVPRKFASLAVPYRGWVRSCLPFLRIAVLPHGVSHDASITAPTISRRNLPSYSSLTMTSTQRVVLVSQNRFAADGPRPQVLMAYEDLNMALRAMNVLALIAREAGDILEIQFSMWRFAFFKSWALREASARQAAQADIIVVAPKNKWRRSAVSGHFVAGRMGRPPPTASRRVGGGVRPRERTPISRHGRPIADGGGSDRYGFFLQRTPAIRCPFHSKKRSHGAMESMRFSGRLCSQPASARTHR